MNSMRGVSKRPTRFGGTAVDGGWRCIDTKIFIKVGLPSFGELSFPSAMHGSGRPAIARSSRKYSAS